MIPSIPLDWLADFELWYGQEELINFIDFLTHQQYWDDDLRDANIGYDDDNRPVIIDYSSFLD